MKTINKKQELIDLMFGIALHIKNNSNYWKEKDNEDLANYVRMALKKRGYNTYPCGMSWGVLDEVEKETVY